MDADDLYGLPLDRFVPERGALAKALRKDKRRDDADEVAGLRKPSVAAWVVNQLVRTQKKATQELFAAGDALRAAQEDLLAGSGDGRTLRAANERERAAVDALADAARGLLSGEGQEPSDAVIERVAGTLHAAALDEAAREQVREGRLERELRHAGLGLGEDVFAATPPPKAAAPKARAKPQPAKEAAEQKPKAKSKGGAAAARAAERERAAEERERAQRAEQARKAARAAEAKARRNAERAGRTLEAAQEEREQAAEALREADEVLAAARRDADEATAAHERTQAELDEL